MKKTVKMIGMALLLGAFAFVGSSCKKNNTDNTSLKVRMPGVEVVNDEGDRAYIDYNAEGNPMIWSKNDQIMFYNLNSTYTKSIRNVYTIYDGIGSTDGYFNGGVMGEAMDLGFYGFYPASKVVNHPIGIRNSQTFDVPATQNYVENQMDPTSLVMACKGQAPVDGFNMEHIFGFANIRLKGTRTVQSVVIEDAKFNLNGNITIDIPAVNGPVLNGLCQNLADYTADYAQTWGLINALLYGGGDYQPLNYTSEPGDKTMTLDCGEGVQLNPTTPTNFVFTLRPGALHQGFTITVNYTEGEPDVITKYCPGTPAYQQAFGNNAARPRGWCVLPGYLRNFSAN